MLLLTFAALAETARLLPEGAAVVYLGAGLSTLGQAGVHLRYGLLQGPFHGVVALGLRSDAWNGSTNGPKDALDVSLGVHIDFD